MQKNRRGPKPVIKEFEEFKKMWGYYNANRAVGRNIKLTVYCVLARQGLRPLGAEELGLPGLQGRSELDYALHPRG